MKRWSWYRVGSILCVVSPGFNCLQYWDSDWLENIYAINISIKRCENSNELCTRNSIHSNSLVLRKRAKSVNERVVWCRSRVFSFCVVSSGGIYLSKSWFCDFVFDGDNCARCSGYIWTDTDFTSLLSWFLSRHYSFEKPYIRGQINHKYPCSSVGDQTLNFLIMVPKMLKIFGVFDKGFSPKTNNHKRFGTRKSTAIGISCLCYLLPVLSILWFQPRGGKNLSYPVYTMILWVCQTLVSLQSDYTTAGKTSYWHTADRVLSCAMAWYKNNSICWHESMSRLWCLHRI